MARIQNEAQVDHEKSYRGLSPRALVHRARLRALVAILRRIEVGPRGLLADFGCSNGFILSELRAACFREPGWELWGFDHAAGYIKAARERRIAGARFEQFDLDLPGDEAPVTFDVVLCLETLEHVGSYRTALGKLARACRAGGYLLISVPNEVGVHGLVKFFGRKVLTRQSYDGFFRGQPQGPYVRALFRGEDLERFREPPRHGWGDHLGFDVRRFEEHLRAHVVGTGSFDLVEAGRPAFGFGRTYLLRRRP
jgi:2-polyprenyl-3-methyl-5-hydroxy-6-metoxy-1,4-benzoquinol methylase